MRSKIKRIPKYCKQNRIQSAKFVSIVFFSHSNPLLFVQFNLKNKPHFPPFNPMVDTKKSSTIVEQISSNDTSTICAKCGEKILNVMTADDNKVYHPHCFNCSDCGKTLAGGFFYKSKNIKSDGPSTSRNSLSEPVRFCETCYKKIAPKWLEKFE